MQRHRWYRHTEHGYMLRVSVGGGYDAVVTALCLGAAEYEADSEAWESHKLRLHVNGGCGAVAYSQLMEADHNPAFRAIDGRSVPKHIRADFTAAL